MGGLTIVTRRRFPVTRERLFTAWTDAAQVEAWWGPAQVTAVGVEIDLRVGGHYRIGNRLPDGRLIWIAGEFIDVRPPSLLVYSWRLGEEAETRVTVSFDAADEGSELTIVHELIESESSKAEHQQGWTGCLDGLAQFLGGP
jgi:uncharacterized protein YndB with AHSA1/START domain